MLTLQDDILADKFWDEYRRKMKGAPFDIKEYMRCAHGNLVKFEEFQSRDGFLLEQAMDAVRDHGRDVAELPLTPSEHRREHTRVLLTLSDVLNAYARFCGK